MEIKKRPLLLAFCIPVAVMLAVIFYKGIYPFGEQCFLRVDMYNQYMPFYTELHRKLRESGSLLFSWRAGLGANFIALYAYYLASPMNWLLLFCPEQLMIEFMTFLIVIKIGLCGSAFAWYLKKHFDTDSYAITLFSVFYALSGYLCAYNWNIMWLDCVILAPIVILGLERLVYQKKSGQYTLALAACMLTNYYISMPVCMFLGLYYLVLFVAVPAKERLKCLWRFVYSSFMAAGMSAILLIPTVCALSSSGFSKTAYPEKIKFYFNILEVLARHCMNVTVELRSEHWPNVYCGTAVFFLLPLYICCKKIAWKEKLPRLLLLAFLYVSFSVNVLDFFWHGLNYPNSLPARQSFLSVFLVLVLCFQAFLHRREYSQRQLVLTEGFALLFLLLCSFFIKNNDFSQSSFALTMLYTVVFALLFYWYREGSLKKNLAGILFSVMVLMEAAVNVAETSVATTNRTEYHNDYRTNRELVSDIENEFVRVEERERMTKNDGMLGDFPSATYFSSTVNKEMGHFYKRLGMSSSKVFYCYDGATPLTAALLSVGYTISDSDKEPMEFYELVEQQNEKYLYRNRYVLPLGYGISESSLAQWELEEGLPFDVNNSLAEAIGIQEKLFEQIPVYETGDEVIIETDERDYLYAYPIACSHKNITAELPEGEKTFNKVYYPRMLDLGLCEKGSRIVLRGSGDIRSAGAGFDVVVYRMKPEVLKQMIQVLGNTPMHIEKMSDTYVSGKIEMPKKGMLVTSVPNEEGWKVKVDGKQTEISPFAGVMLGVELEKGNHLIEFIYTPPGLYSGAVISIASVILFLLLHRSRIVKGAKPKQRHGKQQ